MEGIIFTVFDILNLVLVLLLWIFTLRIYKKLPEKIPTHFDFQGKPDHFGSKKYAFFMPAIGLGIFILLTFLNQYPESANYPVEITKANYEIQYFIMILFVKWLLFLVLLLFLNIQDYTIRYSFNVDSKARVPILIVLPIIFISLMVALISAYIYK